MGGPLLSLIVDDDAYIRAYIRTILQSENFLTLEAEGGDSAWEIMRRLEGDVDLLVSDIQMPRGDGLKLAYSVREEYPSIPIILVSGRAQPDSPFDFVEKPFTWPELVSVVRRVLTAAAPQ